MLGKCIYKVFCNLLMDLKKYGFVMAGELRKNIVKLLEEPKAPTQLKDLIKTQDSAVARCLRDLEQEEVIKLINPDVRKGKVFVLTKEGKEILKKII
jgi:predicted transcriptional regulator